MACTHLPRCPAPSATDASAARVVADHGEQGWALLCNGVVAFDDGGLLLPGRPTPVQPAPPTSRRTLQGTITGPLHVFFPRVAFVA